jgi:hypothetical protein
MSKKVGVLLAVLLAFSIFQVAFVLAESGSGSSGSGSSDDSGESASTSGSAKTQETKTRTEIRTGLVRQEIRTEVRQEMKDGELRNRTRIEIRERTNESQELRAEFREDVRTILKEERDQRIVEFRMKLREHNGSVEFENEDRIKVRVASLNDEQKEIIAGKINARTGLNLSAEDLGNGTRGEVLRAYLSNGNFAIIKIMPDKASAVALSRMKAKCEERNCSIELKEVGAGNKSEARYVIETEKEARTLGVFKSRMKVRAEVNPETGDIILIKKPWWAFLAKEKDEVESEVEDDTNVEANVTASANVSINSSA